MDFELLNFWINKLSLSIKHDGSNEPQLFLSLKAYDNDYLHTYKILLSTNKTSILEFLGFDTSINYDNLTIKNMFEYLCTSNRLKSDYLRFCSFKGPQPKNKLHQQFDSFLKNRYNGQNRTETLTNKQLEMSLLVADAISFFGKDKQYEEYKEKRQLMTKVMTKMNLVKSDNNHFQLFLLLHGVITVAEMTDVIFVRAWNEFTSQNWSCLNSII